MIYTALVTRCVIGMIFTASAVAKLRGPNAFGTFVSWVRNLPVPPVLLTGRGMPLAVAAAGAEAAVVVTVALPWTALAGLMLAAVTLACFAVGAFVVSRSRPGVPCACFGASTASLGLRHVVRDAVLCVIAAAGAAAVAQAAPGSGAAPAAGIVLSLWAALTATAVVVFLDDLAAFARGSRSPRG
jgi:hypothetical protein